MPGLESALVSLLKAEGRASFVARPGGLPMSLEWVIGLGAPAPVLEEIGLSSVILSLGSVDVSPTWGRVPAALEEAFQHCRWMCRDPGPGKTAAGTA